MMAHYWIPDHPIAKLVLKCHTRHMQNVSIRAFIEMGSCKTGDGTTSDVSLESHDTHKKGSREKTLAKSHCDKMEGAVNFSRWIKENASKTSGDVCHLALKCWNRLWKTRKISHFSSWWMEWWPFGAVLDFLNGYSAERQFSFGKPGAMHLAH